MTIPWLLIAILVLVILLAIVAVFVWKKEKRPPDYYTFFWMGIIWLIFGIPMKNYALSAMGLIFTVVGLAHKSRWKENRIKWENLTDKEKKFKIIVMIGLGVLLLAGLTLFFLTERGII